MNRMDAKMTAPVGLVLEDDEMVGAVMAGASESYRDHVKTRAEDSTASAHALPAWIKTQVEQLEMRRKARHLAARPELATMRKID